MYARVIVSASLSRAGLWNDLPTELWLERTVLNRWLLTQTSDR